MSTPDTCGQPLGPGRDGGRCTLPPGHTGDMHTDVPGASPLPASGPPKEVFLYRTNGYLRTPPYGQSGAAHGYTRYVLASGAETREDEQWLKDTQIELAHGFGIIARAERRLAAQKQADGNGLGMSEANQRAKGAEWAQDFLLGKVDYGDFPTVADAERWLEDWAAGK